MLMQRYVPITPHASIRLCSDQDTTVKKRVFDKYFFRCLAALVATNFLLFILVLKPNDKNRPAIYDDTNVSPSEAARANPFRELDEKQVTALFAGLKWSAYRELNLFDMKPDSQSERVDAASRRPESVAVGNSTRYAESAIGVVIEANDGRIPATGEELQLALLKLGDFAQLSIPFSAVALDSGLSHPRVVLAQRPAYFKQDQKSNKTKSTGLRTANETLAAISANKPNLEGRLFLAANMVSTDAAKNPTVKTVEFISWNSHEKKFDFGVIENLGQSPVLRFEEGIRCISCHKNQGPIMGNNPWSNTSHNEYVRQASSSRFSAEGDRVDGMKLLTPQAPEVDSGIRAGADLLQNRKIFRSLIHAPMGRDVLLMLLVAIVEPGSLESHDSRIRSQINSVELSRFMFEATNLIHAAAPSRLIDFNPVDPNGRQNSMSSGWCLDSKLIAEYDAKRAQGHHGLSGIHLPSNPRAFLKLPTRYPSQPSDLISATMLARTIGLTEGDRRFLSDTLAATMNVAGKLQLDASTIARHVFNGSQFGEMMRDGDLPDRDDFKDRFAMALKESLRLRDLPNEFIPSRETYASGPRVRRNRSTETDAERVPTTSCLRCHDVRLAGKTMQSGPIPLLEFDPFDKAAREAWTATADQKRKEAVLGRLLQRLGVDRDMPPEDSLEYQMFRGQKPESFEAVKQFLELELKRVNDKKQVSLQ